MQNSKKKNTRTHNDTLKSTLVRVLLRTYKTCYGKHTVEKRKPPMKKDMHQNHLEKKLNKDIHQDGRTVYIISSRKTLPLYLPSLYLNHELALLLHPAVAFDIRRPLVFPVIVEGELQRRPAAAGKEEGIRGRAKSGSSLEEMGGGGVEGEGGGGELEEVVDVVYGLECGDQKSSSRNKRNRGTGSNAV